MTTIHEDNQGFKRDEKWGKAHRLLVPAFGPLRLRDLHSDTVDISSQLILRWDRMGPEHSIDCNDDFTRLSFDAIGLCTFGYGFNK